MGNFKDRFGLDFLLEKQGTANAPPKRQATSSAAQGPPPGLEQALLAYGNKVVTVLRQSPSGKSALLDIARGLSTRLDTLLPVMQYLTERGFIQRVTEDPVGNDVYALTEVGRNIPA